MTNTVILTVVILTVLGLLLALILFWVAKKFKVEEDPRIDEVEKVMPGANCGGLPAVGHLRMRLSKPGIWIISSARSAAMRP